jgi:hypothetical protein
MPCSGGGGHDVKLSIKALHLAESQIRQKFPDLIKGSTGWIRAVEYRFQRNLRTIK